jgi:hypothetical protein
MGSATSTPTFQAVANNIKGSTTGTAPAAGFLGEVIESTSVNVLTGSITAGTATDLCSVTLTAGVWEIEAQAMLYMAGGNGTVIQGRLGNLLITDNSNTVIRSALSGMCNTNCTPIVSQVVVRQRITISSTTTYKSRFTSIENETPSTITALLSYGSSERPAILRAVRVG